MNAELSQHHHYNRLLPGDQDNKVKHLGYNPSIKDGRRQPRAGGTGRRHYCTIGVDMN